jgi:hypothetical protein
VTWATIDRVALFWRKFSRYTRSEAALDAPVCRDLGLRSAEALDRPKRLTAQMPNVRAPRTNE